MDSLSNTIEGYLSKKRELEQQLQPLNNKIAEANAKIKLASEKSEIALKALQSVGLEYFDTEKVAASFRTITEKSMDLEKAESEKLGSIQMNFRLQQEEALEFSEMAL